jgi:demethylmenaquinone methyltransferase/2-methoxy-6-polyprenyl-1,4-benzoquinol methylase
MPTPLRTLSYHYPWLYRAISEVTTLVVGGQRRFHRLPLEDLDIRRGDRVLDLCCGRGEATEVLLEFADNVTGLDASPKAIAQARQSVPTATFTVGWAQDLPFDDSTFDFVHTSAALHEMSSGVLSSILREAHRVLKPGGTFAAIDFHKPQNWLMWPGLAIFLWVFETETAWRMLEDDLPQLIRATGFVEVRQQLHAGGSLQVLQARKGESLQQAPEKTAV